MKGPTAPKPARKFGHLRIEVIEGRALLGFGRATWRWRTVYVENGEIGVWSENYNSRAECERSVRAHRRYLGACEVRSIGYDGKVERNALWVERP